MCPSAFRSDLPALQLRRSHLRRGAERHRTMRLLPGWVRRAQLHGMCVRIFWLDLPTLHVCPRGLQRHDGRRRHVLLLQPRMDRNELHHVRRGILGRHLPNLHVSARDLQRWARRRRHLLFLLRPLDRRQLRHVPHRNLGYELRASLPVRRPQHVRPGHRSLRRLPARLVGCQLRYDGPRPLLEVRRDQWHDRSRLVGQQPDRKLHVDRRPAPSCTWGRTAVDGELGSHESFVPE
jgi:hypothetical protein